MWVFQCMVPDMVEMIFPNFYKLPNVYLQGCWMILFLKATNVVFLDELFFLIYAAVCFHIDLPGGLNFIFTRQFFSQIIYLIQYVKGTLAMRHAVGDQRVGTPGGWWLLLAAHGPGSTQLVAAAWGSGRGLSVQLWPGRQFQGSFTGILLHLWQFR